MLIDWDSSWGKAAVRIWLVTYISVDLWILILFCGLISYYYYFVAQLSLALADFTFFKLASVFFECFLTLWTHKVPDPSCIFCSSLDTVTSPRSPIYFYWMMVFRDQDMGRGCAHCYWGSLVLGLSVNTAKTYMYIHWPLGTRTSTFWLCVCVHVKSWVSADASDSRPTSHSWF